MIVTIKFIAGQEIDLEVESDYTISSLKELVSRQFNVPVEQQRLVFKVIIKSVERLHFYMRPRISIRGFVRPSVGPSRDFFYGRKRTNNE